MNFKKSKRPQPRVYTERDNFRTPFYAVKAIIPYIPKEFYEKTIWECASGELHIVRALRYYKFKVLATDLFSTDSNLRIDFLKDSPPVDDFVIITNPPYSLKREFIARAIAYNVPFAFLIQADYSQWLIKVLETEGVQRLTPRKRINFITPHHRPNTSAHFHSIWIVRYFNLPKDEIFIDINPKDPIDVEETP